MTQPLIQNDAPITLMTQRLHPKDAVITPRLPEKNVKFETPQSYFGHYSVF